MQKIVALLAFVDKMLVWNNLSHTLKHQSIYASQFDILSFHL